MPNEQTSVPLYAASEVLTAANMNISAGTGVPVFATTVTRDAAFGGAGEKVLAEGQLCYLSSTNVVQYYDGAAWATLAPTSSGLTLVSATTIGTTVSSVTITGAFSATYDAYKIVISGGVASGSSNFNLVFGATTTGYVWGSIYNNYGASVVGGGSTTASNIDLIGNGTTAQLNFNVDVVNPFLAKPTQVNGFFIDPSNSGSTRGYLNNTTSYTDFKITPGSGTLTGGTVRVYGYANS